MTCAAVLDLAPRIRLYPWASTPPRPEQGWLALPQKSRGETQSFVFGDGSHPTTRLCAAVVDQLCRQRQPQAVLDVGTGTGVLARIARARGARLIVGTDIDTDALGCAAANAALDAHPVTIVFSCDSPDAWVAQFDLVVANILEQPLHDLAPALFRALAPHGVLAISGFTHAQAPALRVRYEREGLRLRGESHLEEWALLAFGAAE